MNPNRKRILEYIAAHHEREGRYPAIMEIARGLALSRQRVHDNLKMLRHLGYIQMVDNRQIVAIRLPGEPALKAVR